MLLAVPPADFILHNSLFLVAHFHNVIIGGVLFGLFAGIYFWFPKAFGFRLDPFWGKVSFWFWVTGFYFAFMPLYLLGLMGVTRRLSHFEDPTLQIWFVIAAIGAVMILFGILATIMQFYVSIRHRHELADLTGDPWNGRTLEWSTSSPPPAYNFAFTPMVHDHDAWFDMKSRGYARPLTRLQADPYAQEHGRGRDPVGVERGARLRDDLVHLVARGPVVCGPARGRDRAHVQLQPRLPHPGRRGRPAGGRTHAPPRGACLMTTGTAGNATASGTENLTFYVADEHGHAEGATMLGFWIYLMSDCLIFAVLFACYGVLGRNYAAGPRGPTCST